MAYSLAERVLRAINVAFIVTDRSFTIIDVDGPIPQVYESPEPLLGSTSLYAVVPEFIGYEAELEAVLSATQDELRISTVNRERADGKLDYFNFSVLPNTDATGDISGLLVVFENVSPRAVVEQSITQQRNELFLLRDQLNIQNLKLETANRELLQLDEMKSRFVAVAAHELRSPLAAISGYLELLGDSEMGPISDQHANFVSVLQRSTGRLMGIVNNLLDVTRIEAGQLELTMAPHNMEEIVESVTTELMPRLSAKQHQLIIDVQEQSSMALCDGERTLQIVTNLLSNAIKYTPDRGTITITIRECPEQGVLQLSIHDTGIGIPPEDQPKMFQSFYRAGNVFRTGASGTGLGLNITRSLVELHGGKIWFESTQGAGSTFYFTLPLAGSYLPTTS